MAPLSLSAAIYKTQQQQKNPQVYMILFIANLPSLLLHLNFLAESGDFSAYSRDVV